MHHFAIFFTSLPQFKMHYFFFPCRKGFSSSWEYWQRSGLNSSQGTEIIIWTEATNSGDCSYICSWHGTSVQFKGAKLLCIVNGKSKAPISQTVAAPKADTWGRCESSPPIKWGLSPNLKWKLRQMESAINTARLHQGVAELLNTM